MVALSAGLGRTGKEEALGCPNPGLSAGLGGTGSGTERWGCLKWQNCCRSVTP